MSHLDAEFRKQSMPSVKHLVTNQVRVLDHVGPDYHEPSTVSRTTGLRNHLSRLPLTLRKNNWFLGDRDQLWCKLKRVFHVLLLWLTIAIKEQQQTRGSHGYLSSTRNTRRWKSVSINNIRSMNLLTHPRLPDIFVHSATSWEMLHATRNSANCRMFFIFPCCALSMTSLQWNEKSQSTRFLFRPSSTCLNFLATRMTEARLLLLMVGIRVTSMNCAASFCIKAQVLIMATMRPRFMTQSMMSCFCLQKKIDRSQIAVMVPV